MVVRIWIIINTGIYVLITLAALSSVTRFSKIWFKVIIPEFKNYFINTIKIYSFPIKEDKCVEERRRGIDDFLFLGLNLVF